MHVPDTATERQDPANQDTCGVAAHESDLPRISSLD